MTPEELTAAQSKVNELDTQAAELRRGIDEGIERARAINGSVRVAQQSLRQIETQAIGLKAQIREHQRAESARKAAEAKAAAEKAAKEVAEG